MAAPARAEAQRDSVAQARRHYEQGRRAHRRGDRDAAIREWRASYDAHASWTALAALARAYAETDRDRDALDALRLLLSAHASELAPAALRRYRGQAEALERQVGDRVAAELEWPVAPFGGPRGDRNPQSVDRRLWGDELLVVGLASFGVGYIVTLVVGGVWEDRLCGYSWEFAGIPLAGGLIASGTEGCGAADLLGVMIPLAATQLAGLVMTILWLARPTRPEIRVETESAVALVPAAPGADILGVSLVGKVRW